jgi:hypothetical protein
MMASVADDDDSDNLATAQRAPRYLSHRERLWPQAPIPERRRRLSHARRRRSTLRAFRGASCGSALQRGSAVTKYLAFGAVALLLGACESPGADGERATNGCPSGRTCVRGVSGLSFLGGSIGGEETLVLPATATGGMQRIAIYDVDTFQPFAQPFVASSSDESVATVTMSSDPIVGGIIAITGVSEGTTTIVIENMAGELFDQIDADVRSIARIELVPVNSRVRTAHTKRPYVFFRGGPASAMAAFLDASGRRVVDESAEWESPVAEEATYYSGDWSTQYFVVPDAEVLDVAITSGSGARFTTTAPIVTAFDRIARVGSAESTLRPLRMPAGAEHSICYLGLAGDRLVMGAPLTFEASGAVAIVPGTDIDEFLGPGESRCVSLAGSAAGSGELRVTGSGRELVDLIEVR